MIQCLVGKNLLIAHQKNIINGFKETISKVLAEKYGCLRYDVDEKFDEHQKLSNPTDHPNMNKTFKNADEFFLRDTNDYVQWLKDNTSEQMNLF